MSTARNITFARSAKDVAAQRGCALRARATASRTSAAVVTGTSPIVSLVAGLEILSRRRPSASIG
jgi:hypothetical protein